MSHARMILAVSLALASPFSSRLMAQGQVTPDGSLMTKAPNLTNQNAIFLLSGLAVGQSYWLNWTCTGPVLNCVATRGSSFTATGTSENWPIEFDTSEPGVGRIELRLNWGSGTDVGSYSVAVLPPPANTTYTLTYVDGNGPLDRITDPTARVLDVTILGGLLTTITDPDTKTVGYGYDGQRRLTTRTNRLNHTTRFRYTKGLRVTAIDMPLNAQDTATTSITNWDESGLVIGQPGGGPYAPRDPALVYTEANGPRTDSADVTRFWVDRWGAPTRIRNAHGFNTFVIRGDPTVPALVTEVQAPNGFVTRATYDTRGNPLTITEVDPYAPDDLTDAVTSYTWHPTCDLATRVTRPEQDFLEFGYDGTACNRLWQQDGRGVASRVNFNYTNSHGLVSSVVLPGGAKDSVAYSGDLGNPFWFRTAEGWVTIHRQDLKGRDTLVLTPIGAGLQQRDRLLYDAMNRVVDQYTIGPAMSGVGSQIIRVHHSYDAEGRDTVLTRWSSPDSAGIGQIATRWVYDWAGRPIVEVAPDGYRDSTVYDEAGNPDTVFTRRSDPTSGVRVKVTMRYDALNRLIERVLPAVAYPRDSVGLATSSTDVLLYHGYPYYGNDPQDGYTVFADTARFAYNVLGKDSVADNRDARIRRVYFPNGTLRAESLQIRTVAELGSGGSFDLHKYGVGYTYDLNGRRTILKYPAQLAPVSPQDRAQFVYHPQMGALTDVWDPLGNHFVYHYNLRGEMDTLTYASLSVPVADSRTYDADGRLVRHLVRDAVPDTIRHTELQYDMRGKVISSYNSHLDRDTLVTTYSGLGHLVTSRHTAWGFDYQGELRATSHDTLRQDALGNIRRSRFVRERLYSLGGDTTSPGPKVNTYQIGTGRLVSALSQGNSALDTLRYDEAGNITGTWQVPGYSQNAKYLEDRFSYYAADGTVRAADYRRADGTPGQNGPNRLVFEEYRYDAYGRRVWVRARRSCTGITVTVQADSAEHGECRTDLVRRTVWDGFQELAEIQQPGGDGEPPSVLENDDVTLQRGAPDGMDENPYFGRVLYTYGRVLDQPLSLTRLGYGSIRDPYYQPIEYRAWQPFSFLPLWNHVGVPDHGGFGLGAVPCQTVGQDSNCVRMRSPFTWSALNVQEFIPAYWHGTVIEDKRDKAQTLYRRNRVYDPVTGRFTQEDPIGLAGGLNLYGFAGGDPVNFSDPFGLKEEAGAGGGPCDKIPNSLMLLVCLVAQDITHKVVDAVTGGARVPNLPDAPIAPTPGVTPEPPAAPGSPPVQRVTPAQNPGAIRPYRVAPLRPMQFSRPGVILRGVVPVLIILDAWLMAKEWERMQTCTYNPLCAD